jgi:tripartite-type tricarboxylate transporter receptor subunit TctC
MLANLTRVAVACLVAATFTASAQDYPNKSITVVVPFAAGGPTDTLARNLGVTLTNTLKQQVVVENTGGAGGTIGINTVSYTHLTLPTSP